MPWSASDEGAWEAKNRALFLLAAVLLLVGSSWLAANKMPWCDEGWFANPAYNLAFKGKMGSNVLEPSGHFLNAYLSGVRERTYVTTPAHMVALAGWYRVFGFSLMSTRGYSIVWCTAALLAMFLLVRRAFPNGLAAGIAAIMMAGDFAVQWGAADGRMEAATLSLSLWALLAYLRWRERNFALAVLVSQMLLASAVYMHPFAMLVGLVLPVWALVFDRQRLRWSHLALAAAPYLALGATWLPYILESPGDFRAQFFANATGATAGRLSSLLEPWTMVARELARQTAIFGAWGWWGLEESPRSTLLLPLYFGGLVWFWKTRRKWEGQARMFWVAVATVILTLTFLNGFKFFVYMLYLFPFYDAVLALWVWSLWNRRGNHRVAAVAVATVFLALQMSRTVTHGRVHEYDRDYLGAVRVLQSERAQGRSIVGTAALGFGLGFAGFSDDWRLGAYSGLRPDVLVIDHSYRDFARRFEQKEPRVFEHIRHTLTTEYCLSQRFGSIWILRRCRSQAALLLAGSGNVPMQEKGKQAEYLFNLLERCGGAAQPSQNTKTP